MTSFSGLIDRFGIGDFAATIGITYGAAKQMRRRNSIAPEHWPAVVAACAARGWDDVTADTLMALASRRCAPQGTPHEVAA